jgi:hypothetical protein
MKIKYKYALFALLGLALVAAVALVQVKLLALLGVGKLMMAANPLNATNCDPRLVVVDDAMSLTRASITGWSKTDIENNFFKEVGLDRIIAQTKEARMAGVKQRSLTDLLLSRHTTLKSRSASAYPSSIQPFRFEPRRNRVNPSYFRVSAGAAQGGGAPAAHWKLTVNNGSLDADSSKWVTSPNNALKNIEKFFLVGHNVTIEWRAANGVAKTAVMRIISSTNIDANQAYVVVAPNKTYAGDVNYGMPAVGRVAADNGWWEVASGAEQANYQPTVGVLKIQTNSVSDYRSYGYALPGINDFGLLDRWKQTYRWVHKYNDAYVEALEAANTSDGLKKFRLLPLAKLRAQQEKMHEDFFYETVFFGDEINEKQTTTDWQSLPVVQDPAWAASGESGTLNLEFESNTHGIQTQINRCGNVLDKQGGVLDVDEILEAGYNVRREREGDSAGSSVTDIDILCDMRWTRPTLRSLFTKYFKSKYAVDNINSFCEMGKKISFNDSVMWEYDSYDLPDHGYRLNVISDLYFDDRIAQFTNAQKSRGRSILMIDWSDIYINVLKTNSVKRTNNLADDLYKYVMAQNVQHALMNSKTFEVEVGNTNRHRIINNFSDGNPKLTVQGVDLTGA